MKWSVDQATVAARSALACVGGASPLELLRFGGSAVFKADQLVVRVAPSELTPVETASAARRLADWLNDRGIPVVQPAGTKADAQSVGGSTVSLWLWEQATEATVPGTTHGSLLRDLHRLLDDYEDALPRSTCLAAVECRLQLAVAHPRLHAEALHLHRAFDNLADRLASVEPALPPGPIHGDPHGGNFLLTPRGWIVLDLDGVASGYREWDWSSGARTHHGAELRKFIESYGEADIEKWDGYENLVRLKLLDTIAWTAIHDRATNGTGEAVAQTLAGLSAAL